MVKSVTELPTPPDKPPHNFALQTDDIRCFILQTLTDKRLKAFEQRQIICDGVLKALLKRAKLFYHADMRDFESCMVFDSERHLLERIRSDSFNSWLAEWLSINRVDNLFLHVISAIETAALSPEHATGISPEAFWASRSGAVYLSNGDGHLVKITGTSIETLENGTDGVLFPCGKTLAPWKLTEPKDPFESCSLFSGISCAAAHGQTLLKLWIYSLPTSPRSKPPLCASGTVGSGKTRTIKGICELLGIPFIAQKVEDNGEADFWPAINQGGILTLDNADTRCKWLADTLANAATDGSSQKRRLYTNAETVTLRARAWVAVTTANPSFAADPGLADRMLVVRLDRRADGDTSDSALSDNILENRDNGLSHIAMILQKAMADTAPTPAGLNYRHPDFAVFAVRIGRALGKETEAVEALRAAEDDKSRFCVENDFIGQTMMAFLNTESRFYGNAGELLDKLRAIDGDFETVSAKKLGKRLANLWPHLEKLYRCRREKDRNGVTVFDFKPKND